MHPVYADHEDIGIMILQNVGTTAHVFNYVSNTRFVMKVHYYDYHNSGHCPSSCLLFQNTGFCFHLQVDPTQLGPIERASLSLDFSAGPI
jgi:hypothetical protein